MTLIIYNIQQVEQNGTLTFNINSVYPKIAEPQILRNRAQERFLADDTVWIQERKESSAHQSLLGIYYRAVTQLLPCVLSKPLTT